MKVTVKSWLLFGEVVSLVLCACILSRSVMSNSVNAWTVARQTPLSVGFSRQEYWSVLPVPPPGDHPDSGIEPGSSVSPKLQVSSLPAEPPRKPPHWSYCI